MALLPSAAQDVFRRRGRKGRRLAEISRESGALADEYEYSSGMLCSTCGLRLPESGVCGICGHGRYNAVRREDYLYCSGEGCFSTSGKRTAQRDGWRVNGGGDPLCPNCYEKY